MRTPVLKICTCAKGIEKNHLSTIWGYSNTQVCVCVCVCVCGFICSCLYTGDRRTGLGLDRGWEEGQKTFQVYVNNHPKDINSSFCI